MAAQSPCVLGQREGRKAMRTHGYGLKNLPKGCEFGRDLCYSSSTAGDSQIVVHIVHYIVS